MPERGPPCGGRGDRGSENAEVVACNRPQNANEELSGLVRRDGSNTGEACVEKERRDTSTSRYEGHFVSSRDIALSMSHPTTEHSARASGTSRVRGCLSKGTRSSIAEGRRRGEWGREECRSDGEQGRPR